MHQQLLGIDIGRAPDLTAALTTAATRAAAAADLVVEAEARCELTTGAVGPLDDLGRELAALAAAISAAADQLASFRLPPIHRPRRRAQVDAGVGGGEGPSVPASSAAAPSEASTSRRRPRDVEPYAPPSGDGDEHEPAFVQIGLDHLASGIAAGAPGAAASLAERAGRQRWLAGLIDDARIGGPPIRLDPRFTMTDTRYWFAWARHDLRLQGQAFVARSQATGLDAAASSTRALGRISLIAGGALSLHTIYRDGRAAYTSSNGGTGETTIAVLRASAGQAIEWVATSATGAACAPGGPVAIGICASASSVAVDGRGVEVVDEYFGALDDVAEDMGLTNYNDRRSFGQRVVDLFDLGPWS